MPFSSINSTLSLAGSALRAISAVVIASFLASTIGYLAMTASILPTSVGENSFVELISRSAVINARASLPTTFVRFWISDRNATTDPTPNAMQRKKNNSRRHDERISRRVRLKMNRITFYYRGTVAERQKLTG